MKNIFLALPAMLLIAGNALNQTEVDLYRFSNTFNEGSARFESMGGSFGALGADIGSARINPAGFARYSSSQFSFGLSTITTSNKTEFRGNTANNNITKFKLANTGIVITSDMSERRSGYLYQQLGIGYTGVANFRNSWTYHGQQFESLLDGFCGQAIGVDPADLSNYYPFSTFLAYNTYAIDYNSGNGEYIPRLTNGDMIHTRTVETNGGINELHISYSANYLNKLYFGANVGFQFLRYTEYTHHNEVLMDTVGVSLRSFDYYYNLKTKGNGTNVKIGVIYLPVESVRLGLAFHTPTYFELEDDWSADMVAQHSSTTYDIASSLKPSGNYKYRMRTPARLIGSAAFVFGTHGCINIDAEYLDYRWAHFKTTLDDNYAKYDYAAENKAADERFRPVLNIRVGGELVLNTNFFLRAGYGYLPKGDTALYTYGGKADHQISGGAGVRLNSWTLDLAIRNLSQTKTYIAFPGSSANIHTNQLYVVLNAQVKF